MKKYILLTAIVFIGVKGFAQQDFYDVTQVDGNGVRFWSSNWYKISMGNTSEYHYGPVTGYSIKTNMTNHSDRGWVWGIKDQTPVMAISTTGIMQLKSNLYSFGKIGIGTSDPETNLHIEGAPWSGIKIQNTTTTGGRGTMNQYLDGNNDGWQMYFGGHYSGQPLRFGAISQGTYTGTIFTLLDDGNVGLGTEAPVDKLHVSGGNITIGNANNLEYNIWFRPSDNNARSSVIGYSSNVVSNDYIGMQTKWGSIRFYTNDKNEVLRITDSERVGIGTTNPDSKLTVAGNIHSREVKVTVEAGADFVFDSGYQLMTLQETEKFISQNKHLPEIASEEEMLENGLKVGEMNIKLLQKIEELTLYLIEQNKQNQTQQAEIEALKAKIDQLESK